MRLPSDNTGQKARWLHQNRASDPGDGGAPGRVLCSGDGFLSQHVYPSHRRWRRRAGALVGPPQHDAWRLAEYLAEADALARGAAIRGDRHYYARGLGHGQIGPARIRQELAVGSWVWDGR